MPKKLVITGAKGYLARLVSLFNKDRFEIIPLGREELDLSEPEAVEKVLSKLDFDLLFHTAANATTVLCEQNPELTHRINTESALVADQVCQQKGARFIFLSTEQCFNGIESGAPFDEEVELNSVTAYGQQKAEVDNWLFEHDPSALIIRLSWMMGMALPSVVPSPNIVGNTLRALRTETPTKFTCNERRCMTYAQLLAENFGALSELPGGRYNFASSNDLTTYESALYIAESFGYSPDAIERYILPDTERYSDRFRDFRLDSSKLAAAGINLASFKENIARLKADFGY